MIRPADVHCTVRLESFACRHSAYISECSNYRYFQWQRWKTFRFVLLNRFNHLYFDIAVKIESIVCLRASIIVDDFKRNKKCHRSIFVRDLMRNTRQVYYFTMKRLTELTFRTNYLQTNKENKWKKNCWNRKFHIEKEKVSYILLHCLHFFTISNVNEIKI